MGGVRYDPVAQTAWRHYDAAVRTQASSASRLSTGRTETSNGADPADVVRAAQAQRARATITGARAHTRSAADVATLAAASLTTAVDTLIELRTATIAARAGHDPALWAPAAAALLDSVAATLATPQIGGAPLFAGVAGTAVAYEPPIPPIPEVPATVARWVGDNAPAAGPITISGPQTLEVTLDTGAVAVAIGTLDGDGDPVDVTYDTLDDLVAAINDALDTHPGGAPMRLDVDAGTVVVSAATFGVASSVTVDGGDLAAVLGIDTGTQVAGADLIPEVPGVPEVPASREEPITFEFWSGGDTTVSLVAPLLDLLELGLDTFDVGATDATDRVDAAIVLLAGHQARFGGFASAMEARDAALAVAEVAATDAAGRIDGVDIAAESITYARAGVTVGAATGVLAAYASTRRALADELFGTLDVTV